MRRFDAGIVGGLGFEARMGGVILGLDGRHEYGLSDIFPGQSLENRNRTIFVLPSVSPTRQGHLKAGHRPLRRQRRQHGEFAFEHHAEVDTYTGVMFERIARHAGFGSAAATAARRFPRLDVSPCYTLS